MSYSGLSSTSVQNSLLAFHRLLRRLPHQRLLWIRVTLLTPTFYYGTDKTVLLIAIILAHIPTQSRVSLPQFYLTNRTAYIALKYPSRDATATFDWVYSRHNSICSSPSYTNFLLSRFKRIVAGNTGFEPMTHWLTASCSTY